MLCAILFLLLVRLTRNMVIVELLPKRGTRRRTRRREGRRVGKYTGSAPLNYSEEQTTI